MNDTGCALDSAWARAVASIAGSRSIPVTDPARPTSSAFRKATDPGPQPMSSTVMPSVIPASRSTCRVLGWRSSASSFSRVISAAELPNT